MSSSAGDTTNSAGGALSGIRVLDFTRHMAGPYATALLSDHGAEVTKIESMPHGDPSRRTGDSYTGGENALFLMWNRGKRSVQINLRDPRGVEICQRMAEHADVVVENYRPGIADEIGIGYAELAALNPQLIYVSISAFGRGPLEDRPGTDPVIQAMSGVMSVTGERNGGPLLVGVPIADFTGAMFAMNAIALGLLARERHGVGQHIEVPMLQGLMASLTTRLAAHWATGENPVRQGAAHSAVAPYQAYETADGWAVAGVWGAGEGWGDFCKALARPDLIDDPRFASNTDRLRNREALDEELIPVFRGKATATWQSRFAEFGALFGPVHEFSEILDHPHIQQSGLVTDVEHARAGVIKQLGPVLQMSGTPASVRQAPPVLGAHTHEVLEALGYVDAEIDDFLERGTVGASADSARSMATSTKVAHTDR